MPECRVGSLQIPRLRHHCSKLRSAGTQSSFQRCSLGRVQCTVIGPGRPVVVAVCVVVRPGADATTCAVAVLRGTGGSTYAQSGATVTRHARNPDTPQVSRYVNSSNISRNFIVPFCRQAIPLLCESIGSGCGSGQKTNAWFSGRARLASDRIEKRARSVLRALRPAVVPGGRRRGVAPETALLCARIMFRFLVERTLRRRKFPSVAAKEPGETSTKLSQTHIILTDGDSAHAAPVAVSLAAVGNRVTLVRQLTE